MSSERRLHPISVLFDLAEKLPRALLPLFAVLIGTRGLGSTGIVLLAMSPIVVAMAVASIVRYRRFTFRYEERELVVRSGLFVRNERRIPYARIQNLDASRNILHRAFGVAAVYVQTGGGVEPEAKLRVLPMEAVDEMRARVLAAAVVAAPDSSAPAAEAGIVHDAAGAIAAAADHARPVAPVERRTLLRLKPRDLVIAGFIENRGLVLIAGALALLQQAGQTERYAVRMIDGGIRTVIARWTGGVEISVVQGALYVVILALVLLLFVRLLSTVWALIRLFDFRLDRVGDDLHTEYGLFTRVSATIPLRRVQTIIVREGVVHRMLGMRSVAVETAGGLGTQRDAPQREPIAPIIPAAHVAALLDEIQPGVDIENVAWQPVHRRAFGRIIRGTMLWPLLLGVVAFVLVREWAAGIWIGAGVYLVLHARLRARTLGWSLADEYVAVRDGALTRTTRVARYNRLQVAALQRNPFDLRTGMATVRGDTAGVRGGITVPFLPERTALELHDQLVTRAAATGFTW